MSDERDILAEWHSLSFSAEGRRYLLDYAAVLLRVLSDPTHPRRDDPSLRERALLVAEVLDDVVPNWEGGELLHIEDAFGLKRRPRWYRDAALREHRFKYFAAQLVREERKAGATTDDVFRIVYESGLLPADVGESKIKEWYYQCKASMPELYNFPEEE